MVKSESAASMAAVCPGGSTARSLVIGWVRDSRCIGAIVV